METVEVEVWVLVDENGDYVASEEIDKVADRYDEYVGGAASIPRRLVKVTLRVPKPTHQEMSGVVPPEPQQGTLSAS